MFFDHFVAVAGTPQGFILPVLGILAVTSEWSQRTGLTTFTLEPSRGRLLAAKTTAVILIGLVAVALIFAAAALCNAIGMARGGDGSWDYDGAQGYFDIVVVQMLGLLGGLAFGTVLLNSAAAITLNFVLPLVSGILFAIIPGITDAGPWIDAGTAQQPLFNRDVSAHEWAQIVVTSLWWVWVPLAVGVWRVLRTEIKSA
jgi:ABC-type transport system involved in multi-copper enzyme maturation permease subunit